MVGEAFYWILNMSLTAGMTGLAVWLIGRIPRLPRRVAAVLWVIPGLRLLIPVALGSRFSLMSLLNRLCERTVIRAVPVYEGTHVILSGTNMMQAAEQYVPLTYKAVPWTTVDLLRRIFFVGGVVWLTVAGALLVLLSVVYIRTCRSLRDAVPHQAYPGVYLSDSVSTPAVYGVLRPRIVIPTSWADADLTWILAHERAHIRRGDNLWRLLALGIACLHWFDPLVWLFLKQLYADLELACDERVTAGLGAEARRDYALSLVEAAKRQSRQPTVLASPFGGAGIHRRLMRILSYRRLSWGAALCFGTMVSVMAWILLTNSV